MKFLSSEKLSPHKYKTPEGYLICTDAILARTGKQTYRKNEVFVDSEDDSEIDVDRKPEEVFSPKTLASFENKPITVEHPDEDVNAGNYNELSVGFVRDVKRGQVNGQDVMLGTLVITDAQTIEEIENDEHTDLSCGYDCDIIDEVNPQQRNIRGNHVALCQQGRAGIARIVDSVKDNKYEIGQLVHNKLENYTGRVVKKVNDFYYIRVTASKPESDYQPGDMVVEKEYNLKDSIKDDYFTSLPDKVKKSEFNDLYYKIREKAEDKWNYRVSTYGDKFKIEIEKAVGAAPGVYGPVGGQWKTVKTIYSIEDSIKDAEMIKVNGVNMIVAKSKEEIPERTHFKQEVQYNGKAYYWHEGFDTKRNYLVPITDSVSNYNMYKSRIEKAIKNDDKQLLEEVKEAVMYAPTSKLSLQEQRDLYNMIKTSNITDSIKDDLVHNYTKQDLDLAQEMLANASSDKEKALIQGLIADIKFELRNQQFEDKLVESSSEEAFNKNIATEIKSGKDLKQAAAIAYSVKRKNDSIKDAKWDKNTLVKAFKLYGNALGSEAEEWAEDVVQNGPTNIDELDYWFNHQATIISRDNMRNVINYLKSHNALRDSKKYEISYVKDSIEHIHVVKANSLQDAIKKVKDNFYGGIKESILRKSNDFILKRLFAELDDLKKKPISIKKENDIYDVKQQLEARVKQIKREFVEDKSYKDNNDLNLLRQYFKETQPNKKMELRHKLKEMGYKEGISGVNSRELMWVELNGKRYEVKNMSNVREL